MKTVNWKQAIKAENKDDIHFDEVLTISTDSEWAEAQYKPNTYDTVLVLPPNNHYNYYVAFYDGGEWCFYRSKR